MAECWNVRWVGKRKQKVFCNKLNSLFTFISGLDQWNFVLHPVHSSSTCDPQGDFVRKWVPELAELPTELIHQPWSCPETELVKYNVCLVKDYPERIVTDLEKSWQGSIEDVTEARRNYGAGLIDELNDRDRMVAGRITVCSNNDNIPRNSSRTVVRIPVQPRSEADDSSDYEK